MAPVPLERSSGQCVKQDAHDGEGRHSNGHQLNKSVNIKSQTTSDFQYYSPSEIRSIYNATSLLNKGITGAGVTISVVDAYGDPYIQGELNNFSNEFGIPTTAVHVVCVDGPCDYYEGIDTGWNTEIALDVEWAHAMAPGATINLYIGSDDGEPLYDGVAAAVAGTNGNGTYLSPSSIISMSWGLPENNFGESGAVAPQFGENYPWLNQVFQQGAAEGITFFASTGDWGAYDQAYGQTSPYGGAIYPSTDPFVTAVGGTSLYLSATSGYLQYPLANATGGYGYETAWSWNSYYGWATGGGFSTFFGQPYWQSGPGVPSGETRGAPDVSWDADPLTGVLVYVNGGFWVYGGTSVGSPSWAGSMALIDQKAGHDLGFINPSIYSILNNPSEYAKAFHDVTVGNDDPLQAGPGWDPVTGVGTPNIGELAVLLAQPSTSLTVLASNSVALRTSADYTSVQIQATVLYGINKMTKGSVSAELTSSTGVSVGGVHMTYNGTMWTGTYQIKPTDPPGMWTATVTAAGGPHRGAGTTTFSVGDGITIFASWGYFVAGQTIPIAAVVTEPGFPLVNVTSGSFTATLHLGTPSGTVEGTVPLTYDSTTKMWEGSFTIRPSAHQGAWVLSVSGTDSAGNRAAPAYSWPNVGLTAATTTDSPTYVLGETIQIYSYPYYDDVYFPTTGSYSATIWNNGVAIGAVPLSFNAAYGLWAGAFDTTAQPAGFYRVVVTGNDGFGNSAYGETLVRVAPQTLKVTTGVAVDNNTTETLSARITYPNDTLTTIGAVDAFTSYGYYYPMTYNEASGGFVALAPTPAVAGGAYSFYVVAFDPWGNTGTSPARTVSATALTCASSAILGAPSTCTATVWGNSSSGTVSWSQVAGSGEVAFPSASCTLSSSNSSLSECQVAVIGETLGSATLEAIYGGDSNNFPSSGTAVITVGTVAVVCTPASEVAGVRTTCTATLVHPSTPVPTGKVTWSASSSGKFSALTCKLSRGSCKVTYIPAAAGTITMTASYAGDKYNQASSGAFYLSVSKKNSTTTVSCSPTSVVLGSSKTMRCTAHVTGYLPEGSVYWFPAGTGNVSLPWSTTCELSAKGRCSVTMTAAGAGMVSMEAFYTGDVGNTYSNGTAGLLIRQAKSILSLSCESTSKDVWTCTSTVTGYNASGTVFWYRMAGRGSVTISPTSCTLSNSSTECQVTVTGASAGKARIEAIYAGDTNNVGSQATKTLTIE